MAQLKAQIDQSSLRRLLKNIDKYGEHIKKQVQQEISFTAGQIRYEAIVAAPYKTGNLKKTSYVNYKRNLLGAEIGFNAKYASHVEFGTTAHIIRPKTKKVLAWGGKNGGKPTNYAKFVRHPGTKPQPFLMPAFERNSKRMKAEILKIVKNRKKPFRPQ